MRILTDPPAIPVVLHVEPGDTVTVLTYCVALFSGTRGRSGSLPHEQTSEEAARFVVEVQPTDDRQPFAVIVPKQADIDANLLELCSLYAASGR